MKKIAVLLLLAIGLVGCGKKEKGTLIIKNNSLYPVVCTVAQNYQKADYTLDPATTKTIAWEHYRKFWIESPNNIVTYEEQGNVITITNTSNIRNYTVKNGIGDLTILDNKQYILLSQDEKYTERISIPIGNSKIKSASFIDVNNMIIDTSTTFSIGDTEYHTFEKIGDFYFFNENKNGELSTTKLNITIINNNIIISK